MNPPTGQLIAKRSLTYWTLVKSQSQGTYLRIIKDILKNSDNTESCLLLSDHSPVTITYINKKVITRGKPCILRNSKTEWSYFQDLLITTFNNCIPQKSMITLYVQLNHAVQQVACNAILICSSPPDSGVPQHAAISSVLFVIYRRSSSCLGYHILCRRHSYSGGS